MKLNELIAARKKTQPSSDRVTKLLVEIEKLDAKREENVFRLHDRVSQLKQQLQLRNRSPKLRTLLDSTIFNLFSYIYIIVF